MALLMALAVLLAGSLPQVVQAGGEAKAAWLKAGATAGRMHVDPFGYSEFGHFQSDAKVKLGDLPAFRFRFWYKGLLAKLPAPAAAFGLDLGGTPLTDESAKELAEFKNLQSLNLGFTQVTDAGLKELARLENLHMLGLDTTKVTDAGLKKLARLKNLQVDLIMER
jgi:internalin A